MNIISKSIYTNKHIIIYKKKQNLHLFYLRYHLIKTMISSSSSSLVNEVPFNLTNSLLEKETISELLRSHGIIQTPFDISIYRKAFLHRSYCTRKNENVISGNTSCPENCIPLQEESNERLEFLGDAILNLVVAEYLFERYPDVNEGFLTVMRTKLVNGKMLAFISKKLNLGQLVVISKQIEMNNGRDNSNILEDAFEALLGAIYIDYNQYKIDTGGKMPMLDSTGVGFQTVSSFIVNVFERYVDFSDLVKQKGNPKDKLTKQCQHNFQWLPKFYEVDIIEKRNKKEHTVCVKNNYKEIISTGTGTSRKHAELDAAKNALKYFGWD